MVEFTLKQALGRNIVVEPFEKSAVLKASQISTVFKVVSIGCLSEFGGVISADLHIGDLIIVESNSVEISKMGQKEVYYVRETSIVASVAPQVQEQGVTFTGSS
jgi:hypothetical protein